MKRVLERCDGCVCDRELVEKELLVVCLDCESSFCQTEGAIRNAALLSCRKHECDGACRLSIFINCCNFNRLSPSLTIER